jgi:3-oxoadipate enol-lactonase
LCDFDEVREVTEMVRRDGAGRGPADQSQAVLKGPVTSEDRFGPTLVTSPTMPTATCNGVELHYERVGAGPRLLYCNGSGTTLDATRPLLQKLSAQFDLLAFDYRGMGRSAPVTEPYEMADAAADVAALLDVVGWDRTALAGLSYGGMVAQEFAVTFPERVDRLALMATSPGGAFSSYPVEALADLPAAERGVRSVLLADRRWTFEWFFNHPEDAALVENLAAGSPAGETAAQVQGRALQLQSRKGHDVLDRLHRVTCPTFVASGAYDDIAPVGNSQAIVDRITDATLHVYQGGHFFLFQDPVAMPAIATFLGA